MKLFGHPESGHVFKVKFFLAVAGIDHEYQEVDIFLPREARPPEFRNHARFQEVPLLIDKGQAYAQSNAILLHLATQTGQWGAQTPNLLKHCREWLFWEANKIGMCLPQLRSAKRFDGAANNEGATQWLLARYANDVARLDAEFADGRDYILGDDLTIADFSLCGYLFLADEADVEVPSNVSRWLKRLAALPAWRHPYELSRASA